MFTQIKMGEIIKPLAIELYRGSLSSKDVCCVMSRSINGAGMHYHQNMGYFYCFKGDCCQDLGLPQLKYIVPLLRYVVEEADGRTKMPKRYGGPLYVQYARFGKEAYESDLLVKDQLGGDVTKQDLLVTCTDEKYQKLKWESMGPAKWRTDPALIAQAQVLAKEYHALIGLSVARTLTPALYAELAALPLRERDNSKGQTSQAPAQATRMQLQAPRVEPEPELLDITPATSGVVEIGGVGSTSSKLPVASNPVAAEDLNLDDLLEVREPIVTQPAAK